LRKKKTQDVIQAKRRKIIGAISKTHTSNEQGANESNEKN
jgi:hypothetical protein